MSFLKPTKGKVILTIIIGLLTLLFLFFSFMSGGGKMCEPGFPCRHPPLTKFFMYTFFVLVWPFVLFASFNLENTLFWIISFILSVLFWYLISCLIIYIFKRK